VIEIGDTDSPEVVENPDRIRVYKLNFVHFNENNEHFIEL
jgi:hypothetical protein